MENSVAEFNLRMKKFRKWGLYIAIWIVLLFTGPFIILGLNGTGFFLGCYMGITSLLVLPAFIQMVRLCRCPRCDTFVGVKGEEFCPLCETPLREVRPESKVQS